MHTLTIETGKNIMRNIVQHSMHCGREKEIDCHSPSQCSLLLTPDIVYCYYVTAVNGNCEREPSNEASVFVPYGKIVLKILASKTTIRSFESIALQVLAID